MSFHVFLSHSSADKPAVEELARRLAKEGIQAWLDKWHLIPGDPWQPAIEKALAESETCAVFVGPSGFGPWQNEEMRAAIDRRVRDSGRRFRVIPVLLPGAERAERSSLPTFLAATTWVEFRDSLDDADAFHRLVCGIRGVEPGPGPGQAILRRPVSISRFARFRCGRCSLFLRTRSSGSMAFERSCGLLPRANRSIAFWPSSVLPAAGSLRWPAPAWSRRLSTMLSRAAPVGRSRFAGRDRIPWRVWRWRFRGRSMSAKAHRRLPS